jgi:hypothetical protein
VNYTFAGLDLKPSSTSVLIIAPYSKINITLSNFTFLYNVKGTNGIYIVAGKY